MSALSRMSAVAETEFHIALRNRWILLATGALTLFAVALALVGSAPSGALKVHPLTLTAASLATLSVYLVPLIALLLTYDSLVGEIERGTLALALATPVARWEMMLGKFAVQFAVLTLAVIIGYGIAGGLIAAMHSWTLPALLDWVRLILTALMLGAVFLALGLALSAASRHTGTAAALAVATWLVAVILYDLALLAAIVSDNGGVFTKKLFPFLVVANPGDAFRLFNLANLDNAAPVSGFDALVRALPYPVTTALAVLTAWLLASLGAALALFRRTIP